MDIAVFAIQFSILKSKFITIEIIEVLSFGFSPLIPLLEICNPFRYANVYGRGNRWVGHFFYCIYNLGVMWIFRRYIGMHIMDVAVG